MESEIVNKKRCSLMGKSDKKKAPENTNGMESREETNMVLRATVPRGGGKRSSCDGLTTSSRPLCENKHDPRQVKANSEECHCALGNQAGI